MYNAHLHFKPGQRVWYLENSRTWKQLQVKFVGMDTRFGDDGWCDIDLPSGNRVCVHEAMLSAVKVGKPGAQN